MACCDSIHAVHKTSCDYIAILLKINLTLRRIISMSKPDNPGNRPDTPPGRPDTPPGRPENPGRPDTPPRPPSRPVG